MVRCCPGGHGYVYESVAVVMDMKVLPWGHCYRFECVTSEYSSC